MAYSDFEYDVYISFSHHDDRPLIEGQAGWISGFARHLELRLSELLGAQPTIFRQALNPDTSDTNFDALERTAVFVAVLSPRYVASDRCTHEFKLFIEAGERSGGVFIENRSRCFKVLKLPVRGQDQSPEMRDVLGYEFFHRDHDLRPEFDPDPSVKGWYWATLGHLANDMADVLVNLRGKKAAVESASERSVPGRVPSEEQLSGVSRRSTGESATDKDIFVSYARDDQSFALELARRIKDSGISVWVDQWDIAEGDDWDRKIDTALYDVPGFLIVISPNSVERDEVRAELRVALNEKKHIFPVLYQECPRKPRQLLSIQWTDLTSKGLEDTAAIQRLVLRMKGKLSQGQP